MKRKPNNIPLKISVRKTLTDFAENTTIHGIGYIFNALIPFIERCLWAVVFGFFAILAIYWSADIAVQWQADPVLTSVKSTGTYYVIFFCHLLSVFHVCSTRNMSLFRLSFANILPVFSNFCYKSM